MKIEQRSWTADTGWEDGAERLDAPAQLVLAFGSQALLSDAAKFAELRTEYPDAHLLMNSTSGEIYDSFVQDDSLVVTAIHFAKTKIKSAAVKIADYADSRAAGRELATAFEAAGLAHLFVISDGLKVNGSELVIGLNEKIPPQVPITGGLAGDGSAFARTLVGLDAQPAEGNIAAIGFYGDALKAGHGSFGGWDNFGPVRTITRAEANVLYEMDNESALKLYKSYLGDEAKGLPGTGLLFPLSIQTADSEERIVRTILAVDEEAQSMTFAGDMPTGAKAQLMKANFDRLIEGAGNSAEQSLSSLREHQAELAICISCVGRKLVLGQRIDEEVEAVREILGDAAIIAGFYSYGEISPLKPETRCELHNQTMTITTFSEE
ncbi:MAG: hypothetical protein GY862_21065 [Gammaproteobacteria bacterium]|nr:hypothetical protein [Gammaproteobacteria bacterium]